MIMTMTHHHVTISILVKKKKSKRSADPYSKKKKQYTMITKVIKNYHKNTHISRNYLITERFRHTTQDNLQRK